MQQDAQLHGAFHHYRAYPDGMGLGVSASAVTDAAEDAVLTVTSPNGASVGCV
jgi:hypothetical protein